MVLARAFKGLPNVRSAYLARVSHGSSIGLTICVRTEIGLDQCVLRGVTTAVEALDESAPSIEVLFIDEVQESKLRRVCAPFYLVNA